MAVAGWLDEWESGERFLGWNECSNTGGVMMTGGSARLSVGRGHRSGFQI